MKKFLAFLVSIVVVVCLGLTTYYFMRNNEIITIKTKEIYCNAGDTIPLASLGIDIKKANVSKKTSFNYNAGGENVTKYIEFDEQSQAFIVSQENAGQVTLVISTTNKKYADFTISVHIGNGTKENPYYIFSESQLEKIGSTYRLDSHYRLMNDITLTSNFKSIGYNTNTKAWSDFNGTFDGQGYSIKGLNLNNVENSSVGLFSSLGANSVIKNLTIQNATISGAYENAGILAGKVAGTVEKVVVKNSTLTNTASNNRTGAVAGSVSGNIKLSYAENIEININGTEQNALTNSKIGGFIGSLNQSTIQACYANNVSINTTFAQVLTGGFAGEMIIGNQSGSIQQSYANATSNDDDFAAFVADVLPSADFKVEEANMLRHFIGNIAVVYGVENGASIADDKLVSYYNKDFFKNAANADSSAFFDKDASLYLIRGFVSANDVILTNEFVFYAIDSNNIENWDTTYVWNTTGNSLPTLKMGNIYPSAPSGEYFRRDLAQVDIANKNTFVSKFSTDIQDEKINLLNDIANDGTIIDLTSGWTPVSIINSTIEGNGVTIKVNLNNTVSGNLGLFTAINNSTIKNLNIIVTGVSANADFAGALAGKIFSTDEMSSANVENVTITFEGFSTPIITNFGGVAGSIENTVISNVVVRNLNVNKDAKLSYAGALVGVVEKNATIKDSSIETSAVYGTTFVGGVAGTNKGTISNISGNVDVKYNATTKNATVGGVVGTNNSAIDNINLVVNITIENAVETHIGGVAGVNAGSISNVTVNGDSIVINVNNASKLNIGGVVGTNNGNITSVANNINTVGTYYVGANHYVGGVASINNGTITKVLTQSNLNGNNVSGVVAQMNNSSAVIDQIVVGKYDAENDKLNKNTITGDKYLAGVVVDFRTGTISNVQASSEIKGQTNETRSSLVSLIFTYGAKLNNATIDSSLSGYGIKYREVWTDFASYSNKAEFGLPASETYDGRFNLYLQDVHHGSMQSVVINSANAGVSGAKASMGGAFAWETDYQNTSESSFVKVVDGFNSFEQFQGKFEFKVGDSSWFGINHYATKTLTFEIGKVWKSSNGISLMFINDLVA